MTLVWWPSWLESVVLVQHPSPHHQRVIWCVGIPDCMGKKCRRLQPQPLALQSLQLSWPPSRADWLTDWHTDKQTDMQTDRQAGMGICLRCARLRSVAIEAQADRHTDRQTDRDRDRRTNPGGYSVPLGKVRCSDMDQRFNPAGRADAGLRHPRNEANIQADIQTGGRTRRRDRQTHRPEVQQAWEICARKTERWICFRYVFWLTIRESTVILDIEPWRNVCASLSFKCQGGTKSWHDPLCGEGVTAMQAHSTSASERMAALKWVWSYRIAWFCLSECCLPETALKLSKRMAEPTVRTSVRIAWFCLSACCLPETAVCSGPPR